MAIKSDLICYHDTAHPIEVDDVEIAGIKNPIFRSLAGFFGAINPAYRGLVNNNKAVSKWMEKIANSSLKTNKDLAGSGSITLENIKIGFSQYPSRALKNSQRIMRETQIEVSKIMGKRGRDYRQQAFLDATINRAKAMEFWARDTFTPPSGVEVYRSVSTEARKVLNTPQSGITPQIWERWVHYMLLLGGKLPVEYLKDMGDIFKAYPDAVPVIQDGLQKAYKEFIEVGKLTSELLARTGIIDKEDTFTGDLFETYSEQYGTSMLWDGFVVNRKKDEFINLVLDDVYPRPPDNVLQDTFGITPSIWKDLGNKPVVVETTSENPLTIHLSNGEELVILGTDGGDKIDVRAGREIKKQILKFHNWEIDSMRIAQIEQMLKDSNGFLETIRQKKSAIMKRYREAMNSLLKRQRASLKAQGRQREIKKTLAELQRDLENIDNIPSNEGRIKELQNRINSRKKLDEEIEELLAKEENLDKEIKSLQSKKDKFLVEVERNKSYNKDIIKRYGKKSQFKGRISLLDSLLNTINKISEGKQRLNYNIDQDFVPSDREKPRRLWNILSKEAKYKALEGGFVGRDLYNHFYNTHEELYAHYALREITGSYNGESTEEIWSNIKKEVEDWKREEEKKIIMEVGDGDPNHPKAVKKINKLQLDTERGIRDLKGVLKRLLGLLEPTGEPSPIEYIGGRFREMAYIAFGSGFWVNAWADAGTLVFNNGFRIFGIKGMEFSVKEILANESKHAVIDIIRFSEEVNSRESRLFELSGNHELQAGIGVRGTWLNQSTTSLRRMLSSGTQITSALSLMKTHNITLKTLAVGKFSDDIVKILKNLDDIIAKAEAGDKESKRIISTLSSLGMNTTTLKQMQAEIKKFPIPEQRGWGDIGAFRWNPHLRAILESGFIHHADRSIITPTAGDAPLLMSNQMAKTIFQFWNHSWAINSKFILPMLQQATIEPNWRQIHSIMTMLFFGALIVGSKDWLRYGEVRERSEGEWIQDILDRSGMLAHLSAPLALGQKVAGFKGSSRWEATGGAELALGATSSVLANIVGGATGAARGDYEKLEKNILNLAPFQTHFRLMQQLSELGE